MNMQCWVALLALVATLCEATGQGAQAQSYATGPPRIVVTISAGSTADILARVIADRLSQSIEQAVIVENRPGARAT